MVRADIDVEERVQGIVQVDLGFLVQSLDIVTVERNDPVVDNSAAVFQFFLSQSKASDTESIKILPVPDESCCRQMSRSSGLDIQSACRLRIECRGVMRSGFSR